ncbi:MAG: TIGR03905 family TSCPD domain-containing protein [Butyrivibrio sp.]|nr:TIGR03905 family TSCPD domain-containing protein [Butyrivibrio sp.]
MVYKTKGTCSTKIELELEGADHLIRNVKFTNGCNGNLQGVSKLVEGMKAEEAIGKLRGIKCGFKNTSCPDQLSYALEEAMNETL